jgi:hypothetical protein
MWLDANDRKLAQDRRLLVPGWTSPSTAWSSNSRGCRSPLEAGSRRRTIAFPEYMQ